MEDEGREMRCIALMKPIIGIVETRENDRKFASKAHNLIVPSQEPK